METLRGVFPVELGDDGRQEYSMPQRHMFDSDLKFAMAASAVQDLPEFMKSRASRVSKELTRFLFDSDDAYQLAKEENAVHEIVTGQVCTFEALQKAAPVATKWLRKSLTLAAHGDKEAKIRAKELLGVFFYTANLKSLGLWDDFRHGCKADALVTGGRIMKDYFVEKQLGRTLGEGFGVAFGLDGEGTSGKIVFDRHQGQFKVLPAQEDTANAAQSDILPTFYCYRRMIFDEEAYIHILRMMGMAINDRFQSAVREACESSGGEFHAAPMKGYQRMMDKCLSRDDHFYESYPRPGKNLDVIRNVSTFETPEDLFQFALMLRSRKDFDKQPIRVKNMFLYNDQQAEDGLHYRTIMINWLYSPGITYHEMVQESGVRLWRAYFDYMELPHFGKKAASVSWCEWRDRIDSATSFLMNVKWKRRPVQFIVETQLLLRPYLDGRRKMHVLYKIIRCAHPKALFNEFRSGDDVDDTSKAYTAAENAALEEVEGKLGNAGLGNGLLDWTQITLLGKHCRAGRKLAVAKLLDVAGLDVNLPTIKGETPLYLAARRGHAEIVELLLEHPLIAPNSADNGGVTPLYVAALKGHITTVYALLKHHAMNVNKAKVDGTTPLYVAAQQGHAEIVAMLLAMKEIDVNCTRTFDATTPLYSAVCYGHRDVVSLLCAQPGLAINRASAEKVTPLGIALYHVGNPEEILAADLPGAALDKQRMLSGCDAIQNAKRMFSNNVPLKDVLENSRRVMRIQDITRISHSSRKMSNRIDLLGQSTLKKRLKPKTKSVEEDRMGVVTILLQHPDIQHVVFDGASGCCVLV
jgi:hypothetical protein